MDWKEIWDHQEKMDPEDQEDIQAEGEMKEHVEIKDQRAQLVKEAQLEFKEIQEI